MTGSTSLCPALVTRFGFFCAAAALAVNLRGAEPLRVEANVMAEITFKAEGRYYDPFNEIVLDAVFSEPGGRTLRVPAFWAGGNQWRVRYSSAHRGQHHFRTECNVKTDAGLHGCEGTVEVVRYRGSNPLLKHGPVRVAADHRHLEHTDGTPFFWLGDTWWMGLCHRLEWPEEFKILTKDRVNKGFTVVQIVAGLYPDMPPFDPRGANEAGFPWETNYSRMRPEYFDAADIRLKYLVDSGITPCLVGAWGYFIPWMGVDRAKQHWRYLIARYGALPIVWCTAGEANLPYYLAKGFPFDDREQVKGWTEVMRSIRETDPFHRPLSLHPTGLGRLTARGAVEDETLLDFDMLQTGHGLREVLAPTVNTARDSYNTTPVMPVINSEVSYEMLLDNIPAEIPRLMFWASMLSGAAGHTYGANGIWQCNRPGQPHGASPHGGNYGKIPWNEAMKLPGSEQLGRGKQFLQSFDWTHLEPRADCVSWAETERAPVWGNWIWFPEGDPKRDAPAEARFFRRAFELPAGSKVKSAHLSVSADDKFTAWVNGSKAGSGASWKSPRETEVGSWLRAGTNVLAIRAENARASVPQNPAGLIASLQIQLDSGQTVTLLTDSSWRASRSGDPDWHRADFDDSGWSSAMVLAKYGEPPWGNLETSDSVVVPFAAGNGERVLLLYVPDPKPVTVNHLRPNTKYRVTSFNPLTGQCARPSDVRATAAGGLEFKPPQTEHDWVIALERH